MSTPMSTPPGDGASEKVVLVVDDESDLVETCARLLARRGYRVVTARSCAGGQAALRDEAPALLVSDLRLPDGDGLGLVRAARSLAPPIPAIVITGYASETTREAARAAGAVAFIGKPFTTELFARAVEEALRHSAPPMEESR